MEFTRTALNTIDKALRSHAATVAYNQTWQQLHAMHDIGQLKGARLALSDKDRRHLRDLVKHQTGVDLLAVDHEMRLSRLRDASRLDIARHLPNEKLSGRSVTEDMVLIGSAHGRIELPDGRIDVLPGMTVSCHHKHLHGLHSVILVENLATMHALEQYQWPAQLDGSVMLFRGSVSQSPKAVSEVINQVSEVVCFPDYDPQGVMNSITQSKSVGIVMPDKAGIDLMLAKGLNKNDLFLKQDGAKQWLQTSASTLPYVSDMLSRGIALSQEAMTQSQTMVVVSTRFL